MKLGILTFPRSMNYGAFMQAYSLSRRLNEDFGCQVEIIDHEAPEARRFYYRHLLMNRRDPFGVGRRWAQYRAFARSAARLPLSYPRFVTSAPEKVYEYIRGRYDVVVVGSDAVWNWTLRGFPSAYFLSEDLGCAKMSYAASAHGMRLDQLSSSQYEWVGDALQKFSYVGVRDQATEEFVKHANASIVTHHNCDPTLLIDAVHVGPELIAKVRRRHGVDLERPTIGLMTANSELGRRAREKFGSRYQLVSLYVRNVYADAYLYDLTPFEWSAVFGCFDLTLTQYFHGMLMSLKQHVPVVTLDFWRYEAKTIGKMQDFLTRIDQSDSYFAENAMSESDWGRFFDRAERLLEQPCKSAIAASLEKEAKAYESFRAALAMHFRRLSSNEQRIES